MAGFEWDIASSVLSEYDADGFLGIQVDAEGESKARVIPYETHSIDGLYSRPAAPTVDANGNHDPATANQVLYALEGGKGHAFPLENPLHVALLPTLHPGEKCFYGPKGQFFRMMADGSIMGWAPSSSSGNADASLSFSEDGFVVAGRWGKLEISDNGIHFVHSSGARIDLGAIGGLPGPAAQIGSYCDIQAGTFSAEASGVSLGAGEAPPVPVPNGVFLLAQLASVQLALKTIAAALASAVPASGITSAQTAAVTAAVGAVVPPTPVLLYTNANATF